MFLFKTKMFSNNLKSVLHRSSIDMIQTIQIFDEPEDY